MIRAFTIRQAASTNGLQTWSDWQVVIDGDVISRHSTQIEAWTAANRPARDLLFKTLGQPLTITKIEDAPESGAIVHFASLTGYRIAYINESNAITIMDLKQ